MRESLDFRKAGETILPAPPEPTPAESPDPAPLPIPGKEA